VGVHHEREDRGVNDPQPSNTLHSEIRSDDICPRRTVTWTHSGTSNSMNTCIGRCQSAKLS
jgi:hypothetical protein